MAEAGLGTPCRGSRRVMAFGSPALILSLISILSGAVAGGAALDDSLRQTVGAAGMLEPHTSSLLIDYYETFLRDRDLDEFRDRVLARYTEETLCRVLSSSPHAVARRGSVLALGVVGSFDGCNAALGRAMRDDDAVVRTMAERALWVVWFRADTPENNQTLEDVRLLVATGRADEAVELATKLIARAPRFAEAYNQRAIAYFMLGRFAESAEDCQRVLAANPYHIGALGGLAQCQMRLDQPREALKTLRRSLKLQPHSQALSDDIRMLEAGLESDGPR